MTAPVHAANARAHHSRSNWTVIGSCLIGLAMVVYIVAWAQGEPTGRGPFVAAGVLLLCVPWILRVRDSDRSFDMAGILVAAIGAKLLGAYARFFMVDTIYNGVGDSTQYHESGRELAPFYRSLDFSVDVGRAIPGTGWARMLTGIVYAIFGSDRFTGFIIFSMLALVGCWFFYRAVEIALPQADHRRYALLLFFWPSVVFWPSAIGKEAWMIFSLGLASWGAAMLYRHRPGGLVVLGLGVAGAALPRPHIAIVVLAAAAVGFVVASLFGRAEGGAAAGFATRVLGVLFLLVAGALLAPKVANFLNIDDVGGSGFTDSLDEVQRRTSQGGSAFEPAAINTPLDYPWAFITVLFRPFPYEVSSAGTAISALEGMALFGLLALSIRRIARVPGSLIQDAYVAYSAAFAFMFVYVFAFIGNFGILARQRVQLLPFLFVLIALYPRERSGPKKARVAARHAEPRQQVAPSSPPPAVAPQRPRHRAPTIAPPRRTP